MVWAKSGFPGRMWVPDHHDKLWLTPLPVYAFGSHAAIVRLMLRRIRGDYATADITNPLCPPQFVWFDTREVALRRKKQGGGL